MRRMNYYYYIYIYILGRERVESYIFMRAWSVFFLFFLFYGILYVLFF